MKMPKVYKKFDPNKDSFLRFQLTLAAVLICVNLAFTHKWKVQPVQMADVEYVDLEELPFMGPIKVIPPEVPKVEEEKPVKEETPVKENSIIEETRDEVETKTETTESKGTDKTDEKNDDNNNPPPLKTITDAFDMTTMSPDVQAEFPGGNYQFNNYLKNELDYPEYAEMDEVECVVKVAFVIKEDGRIGKITILASTEPDYDFEDAVREILERMPNWTPGFYQGNPVSTIVETTIEFELDIW
jgi:TonB family protein